jgi:diaminohydroxyphosphoribosylaminopyrimidine deaminase/5-amino-6-(5-phosphoribosylamino)uracil reductase
MTGAGEDRRWMEAALAYGRRGFGTTAPNPCVAALVVRDGIVVGRGVTAPGGRPHAEPVALAEAGPSARGATLYVTLEPCCHVGRGRPCVEAIVAAGVGRVVAACRDPDPRVAGEGLAVLRAAGIMACVGICEAAARRSHVGHIRRVRDGRPAITLKLAETADGFAAAPPGAPRLMITGETANGWTHVARSMHDAVLVGAGTAREDDPLLTVRLRGMGARQPLRVVMDAQAGLDPAGRLAASAGGTPLLVLVADDAPAARRAALEAAGGATAALPVGPDGRLDLSASLRVLAARGLTRVFCEGGPRLAAGLLAADLVDDLILITAEGRRAGNGRPALDPAARALLAPEDRFLLVADRSLGDDRLRHYERPLPCSPD